MLHKLDAGGLFGCVELPSSQEQRIASVIRPEQQYQSPLADGLSFSDNFQDICCIRECVHHILPSTLQEMQGTLCSITLAPQAGAVDDAEVATQTHARAGVNMKSL
jgi:hypothetical protein